MHSSHRCSHLKSPCNHQIRITDHKVAAAQATKAYGTVEVTLQSFSNSQSDEAESRLHVPAVLPRQPLDWRPGWPQKRHKRTKSSEGLLRLPGNEGLLYRNTLLFANDQVIIQDSEDKLQKSVYIQSNEQRLQPQNIGLLFWDAK
jgi:hypothetical protein